MNQEGFPSDGLKLRRSLPAGVGRKKPKTRETAREAGQQPKTQTRRKRRRRRRRRRTGGQGKKKKKEEEEEEEEELKP